jgi:hypothetical protein
LAVIKKLELASAGKNGVKLFTTFLDIGRQFRFTFPIDRITEVLAPDIYIELTRRKLWQRVAE